MALRAMRAAPSLTAARRKQLFINPKARACFGLQRGFQQSTRAETCTAGGGLASRCRSGGWVDARAKGFTTPLNQRTCALASPGFLCRTLPWPYAVQSGCASAPALSLGCTRRADRLLLWCAALAMIDAFLAFIFLFMPDDRDQAASRCLKTRTFALRIATASQPRVTASREPAAFVRGNVKDHLPFARRGRGSATQCCSSRRSWLM